MKFSRIYNKIDRKTEKNNFQNLHKKYLENKSFNAKKM